MIKERLQKVKNYRNNSKRNATRKLSATPYKFGENRHHETTLIVIPASSSENREYLPMGFLPKGTIVNNSTQAIYYSLPFHLGIISSRMHMVWMRTVAGRLKSDYRYSSSIVYNTFPFPPISEQHQQKITQCVFRKLEEREKHSEKTLAQLYDPDKMPDGLWEAHRANDEVIERCYRARPFESDEERLEYLFRLYEKMISEEQEAN